MGGDADIVDVQADRFVLLQYSGKILSLRFEIAF